MRQRIEELNARTPVEHVRSFMRGHFSGADGIEEVRRDLRNVSPGRFGLQRDLEALEELLSTPLPDGLLAQLVGWDGNWVLDDPSDTGARAFLIDVAKMLRAIIAEAGPSRPRGRRNLS
jgi:hypothetical protein